MQESIGPVWYVVLAGLSGLLVRCTKQDVLGRIGLAIPDRVKWLRPWLAVLFGAAGAVIERRLSGVPITSEVLQEVLMGALSGSLAVTHDQAVVSPLRARAEAKKNAQLDADASIS